MLGYNRQKLGRPSQAYHGYMMTNTRLVFKVEVDPGNHTAAACSAPELWKLLESLHAHERPEMIRGDGVFGVEPVMARAEALQIPYLFRLRQTKNLMNLIAQLFNQPLWHSADQGREGANSELRLSNWTRSRRVVVLRRRMSDELKIKFENAEQLRVGFCLDDRMERRYEYAALVSRLDSLILPLAQLYRDQADCENHFDELKNQWGWGGYTTHDLKRCRLIAHGGPNLQLVVAVRATGAPRHTSGSDQLAPAITTRRGQADRPCRAATTHDHKHARLERSCSARTAPPQRLPQRPTQVCGAVDARAAVVSSPQPRVPQIIARPTLSSASTVPCGIYFMTANCRI